ncbi:hypothetical protein VNO78_09229 [Psophocarpus tetragonolobus]|uniref:Ribosomal protein L34Ae n=1 Tax=Psophocarpus tetragonolobus TaxID=3891 RepID=A0AAN9SWV2_PSOTE
MGTKSLFMAKSHIDSINLRVVNDFVCVSMLWTFASLRVFICNYVLYVFGLVLRCIFRFLNLGDAENELIVQKLTHVERNQVSDSEIDGFREDLASFLFWSEDFHQETEGETESSPFFMDSAPEIEKTLKRDEETDCSDFSMEIVPKSKKSNGETDISVFMATHCDVHEDGVKTEVPTDCSVSTEIESGIHEVGKSVGTEEKGFFFMKSDSDITVIHEDTRETERETEKFVSLETDSDVHHDDEHEDETKGSVFTVNNSNVHHESMKRREKNDEEELEESVSGDKDCVVHGEVMKLDENETESDVLIENVSVETVNDDGEKIDEKEGFVTKEQESNVHGDDTEREEKEELDGPFLVDTNSVTTTCKCEFLSGKDISGFMEEPTTLRFSFRDFYMGPHVSTGSDNAYDCTKIIADKEFSEFGSEKHPEDQAQTEDSVQEQISEPSIHTPRHFESDMFGGTDSSDEDYFLYNENSVTSDSESESSSSSGLIWGNSNRMDDSIVYQFLGDKNGGEGYEPEILKLMMREERAEDVEEKQSSCDGKVSQFSARGIYSEDGYVEMEHCIKGLNSFNAHGFGGKESAKNLVKDKKEEVCRNDLKKSGETRWEDELSDSESDEGDFEWEHDDLVEQLKLELKNSRQGGLATILEGEEEEDEEEEEMMMEEEEKMSPRVVEDQKPMETEEKLEYKDQIDEIEKVYQSYAEKMKKLDILNYQTMHALGLLQLKDPLKLISISKSTIQGSKPVISQNLWPRKASKNSSDPLMKFVHELHRDLELVYVGQVCLSWEILCWQHKKALDLQQYDSQGSHRYNHVAGEFQLFQVLVQRFIENEPFQGPRLQNYVKNRCVIRNLLQVPGIKDDSKGDEEEDAIASGRLAEIIKESMRVFWEFVRADKDYGNVIFKASQHNRIDLKDPVIFGLMVDIKTQLQKKERRLKDIVRTGNCIVKKFQKHHEDQLDHEQLVARVGLRLISRVINMSKLRKEQLIWCNEKIHRIKFLSRKIVQVEPSFLLFPC